jgi:hypothetical protein
VVVGSRGIEAREKLDRGHLVVAVNRAELLAAVLLHVVDLLVMLLHLPFFVTLLVLVRAVALLRVLLASTMVAGDDSTDLLVVFSIVAPICHRSFVRACTVRHTEGQYCSAES